MKKYLIAFIFICLVPNFFVRAQTTSGNNTGEIHLKYKYYGDSVTLRWGYSDAVTWFLSRDQKVEVWRRNVSLKGEYEKIAEVLAWDSTKTELVASQMAQPEMMVVVLENLHRNWENTYFTDYATLLEKSDNLNNRWSLVHLAADLDAQAAEAAGLKFTDTKTDPNITYAYKIMVNGKSDYTVAFPVKQKNTPVLYDFNENDGYVEIFWDKKLHDYHYTAYWIEVSNDGKVFTRVNERPYVQMTDQNISNHRDKYTFAVPVENYKKKFVRLRGLDAFGDTSLPSDIIVVMGRDRTPPRPAFLTVDSVAVHLTKKLTWYFDAGEDVKTCHLERVFKDKVERIENCGNAVRNTFTDVLPEEGIYKYRLIGVDSAGNESYSSPLFTKAQDLIPPLQPVGLRIKSDTTGSILLLWDVHPEKDVIGYNVYGSDKNNRNFVKLNAETVRQLYYVDSIDLHLLTKERYYYIVAVDNDFMRSKPSDTIFITRPDIIPPAPAIISDYKVSQEGIRLTIFPSSSRDVVRHELWKKSETKDWTVLKFFTTMPPSYIDKDVQDGMDYYYKIVARDSSGLSSHVVKEIKLTAFQKPQNKPVLSFTKNGTSIEIIVEGSTKDSIDFLVYRSENNRKMTLYKILDKGIFQEKINDGKQYFYRVRTRNKNGILGPFSDKLSVQM